MSSNTWISPVSRSILTSENGTACGGLLVGGMESVLQRLDEQVEGNALLFLDLAESFYRLLVHSLPPI